VLSLQHLTVTFDGTSGLMKTVANTEKQITLDVTQTLLYYVSHPHDEKDWPPSGAYVFRPANSTTYPLANNVQISVAEVKGFV